MITKVIHGWRPGGLVAYLMGPGQHEEHRNPRVIASWDGLDALWQPDKHGPGDYEFRLGPLINALQLPARAAGLPVTARSQATKRGYVWHCAVRLAPGDRVLTDEEWATITRRLLAGAGIATRGDDGGPRWVAIRHADDHIHIAVVLVRQDTMRRFWPRQDFPKLRQAAGELEREYGLTITAPADRTATHRPRQAELKKARRNHREPARSAVTRAVRTAAAQAFDPDSFVEALRQQHHLVELRHAPSGQPIGYKIARIGDHNAAGNPVYFSGSKLAPDLSLPNLIKRWASAPTPAPRTQALTDAERLDTISAATQTANAARNAVLGARIGLGDEDPDGIAHATADTFTALSTIAKGTNIHGRMIHTAETYDRAARAPHNPVPTLGETGAELRSLAWQLMALRGLRSPAEHDATIVLIVALTALVVEIAAWQQTRGRIHQAAAARATAERLRGPLPGQRRPARLTPQQSVQRRQAASVTYARRPGRDSGPTRAPGLAP